MDIIATFNEATRQLRLPFVSLGELAFQSVVVRLDDMTVLGAEQAESYSSFLRRMQSHTAGGPNTVASYDEGTRRLVLPQVMIGSTVYNNVTVRLNSFVLVAAGQSAAAQCTDANYRMEKYEALTRGMHLDDAVALIGCVPTGSVYAVSVIQGPALTYRFQVTNGTCRINTVFDPVTGRMPLEFDYKGYGCPSVG